MEIMNSRDLRRSPIDCFMAQSQSCSNLLTSEQVKRGIRAIVLFLIVLLLLFIVGVVKTIQISLQLAYQEFELALQDSKPVEISNFQESESTKPVEISNSQKIDDMQQPPSTIAVVRDTRIRSLRKEASQQGIRNVSRMTKAELLTALQYSS
jgi:hypothetical protein